MMANGAPKTRRMVGCRALGLWMGLAGGFGTGCARSGPTVTFSTESIATGVVGAPAESLLRCRGEASGIALEEAGLDASALTEGVRCVADDFDGNGSRDFVLYGNPQDEGGPRVFLAVFTDGPRVLHQFTFSHPGVGDLVRYEPGGRAGPFGEPASTLPGLVQWGEGGTTFVFLFDPATERFAVEEFASENF